jgi:hypothetical protein
MLQAGQKQKQRRPGNKHTLRQRCQRLRFAVPESMIFVSRLQCITHHQQIGQRGGDIHQ